MLSQLSHQLPRRRRSDGLSVCGIWRRRGGDLIAELNCRGLWTWAMNSGASISSISWISHHPGSSEHSCSPREPQLRGPRDHQQDQLKRTGCLSVWAHRCILAIIPLSTLTPQRLRGPQNGAPDRSTACAPWTRYVAAVKTQTRPQWSIEAFSVGDT